MLPSKATDKTEFSAIHSTNTSLEILTRKRWYVEFSKNEIYLIRILIFCPIQKWLTSYIATFVKGAVVAQSMQGFIWLALS